MITILSRDAVFSRMLEIEFSDFANVSTVSSVPSVKDGILFWDVDSMRLPQKDDVRGFDNCILLSRDLDDGEYMELRVIHRPFSCELIRNAVVLPDVVSQSPWFSTELMLVPEKCSAVQSGVEVIFTPIEFSLLNLLFEKGEAGVTIEECGDLFSEQGSNVIQVYIHYLRKKLDKLPDPPRIKTLRGYGYVLVGERNKN